MNATLYEKIMDNLRKGWCMFRYIKKDGSERFAIGTICPDVLDVLGKLKGDKESYESKGGKIYQKYYDLSKCGWRQFNITSLLVDYIGNISNYNAHIYAITILRIYYPKEKNLVKNIFNSAVTMGCYDYKMFKYGKNDALFEYFNERREKTSAMSFVHSKINSGKTDILFGNTPIDYSGNTMTTEDIVVTKKVNSTNTISREETICRCIDTICDMLQTIKKEILK